MNFIVNTMKSQNYIVPEIKVIEVAVEQGFATSTLEGLDRNPSMDW